MKVLLGLAVSVLASAAFAQDAGRGKLLYETHCGGCHYERVHDRLRTKIKDLADLRDEVARWAPETKRQFTLDEREDIVQYLNESHYRIGLPPRGQAPSTHQHSFGDAEKWSHVFDDPQRDEWQKPHEVIQALALKPGATVADIGAGTGYFSARLANMLKKGRVYAVDIEPDMVEYLSARAKREGLPNMVAVTGGADGPHLPAKVDVALFVDVYHHVEERERYFRNLRKSLKPDGRVVIIDYRMDSPEGPPAEARIAPEQAKAEMKKAGYRLTAENSFLPRQYYLVFR
jgi:ubiquinone/menaquinone biosynthesis C-methylase UbiE